MALEFYHPMKKADQYWAFPISREDMNFSECYIAKVKSFLGLKSIDPFLPFDEFMEKNLQKIEMLLEKEQIVIIDAEGQEVDPVLLKQYISESYGNIDKDINFDIDDTTTKSKKILDELKKIEAEIEARTTHKQRLYQSLQESDESNKKILEEGIDSLNKKIEKLQSKQKSLLARANKQLKR